MGLSAVIGRLGPLLAGIMIGVLLTAFVGDAASSRGSRGAVARSSAVSFVPSCPHPSYGADGNVAPLFCKIDNPAALKFYSWIDAPLIALGQNATPGEVLTVLGKVRRKSTSPEICAGYDLAAWRWHWSFGINPPESVTGYSC